ASDPASDAIIIVGAHYDSTSRDSLSAPGATDNGCGVAIVLELARVMSQHRYNHTLMFAFWNAEENRLRGSRAYAEQAAAHSTNISLYLNYDAACYDPYDRHLLDIAYNDRAGGVARLISPYNTLYGTDLALRYDAGDTSSSDHKSFWSHGYPSIAVHSELYGPVHTAEDTVDKASFSYAERNARLGVSVLTDLAGLENTSAD
ncbi:MAG TPA: M20/M25/M40 family metallo-hydrolase, partial [Methanomicrobiales archaeon]|nr:M20/M25/M40 family metallo-hydrolase [Methanomicrobiales archaeon]